MEKEPKLVSVDRFEAKGICSGMYNHILLTKKSCLPQRRPISRQLKQSHKKCHKS